jgi:hypothetical protein
VFYGLNNKKGSTSVFLIMILLTFIFVIGILTEAAAGKASRVYANSVIDLAGRSILSEYDINLKNKYGIFGVITDEETVEKKFNWYLRESFREKEGKINLFRLNIKEIKADLSPYPLTNLNGLEEQILAYMKYRIIHEGLNVFDLLEKEGVLDTYSDSEERKSSEQQTERTLKNKRVLHELPSRQIKDQCSNFPDLTELLDLKELNKVTENTICLNLYILKTFRHQLDNPEWNDTFFKNEIEYILCGRLNDHSNSSIVRASLVALRTGINVAHIYSDKVKMEAVIAAAELIAPGPGALAAQIAIAGSWATAEAINDVKRLEKGGRVPLRKTAEDWVISLDSVIQDQIEPTGLAKNSEEGLNYENYLFLLLCFMNKETKLIRIMDLIQINMKGNYQEDFLISQCYWGVDFASTLERKSGFFVMSGTRIGKFVSSHVY